MRERERERERGGGGGVTPSSVKTAVRKLKRDTVLLLRPTSFFHSLSLDLNAYRCIYFRHILSKNYFNLKPLISL